MYDGGGSYNNTGSLAIIWWFNAMMIYKNGPSKPELTELLGLVALTVSTFYRPLATVFYLGRSVQGP